MMTVSRNEAVNILIDYIRNVIERIQHDLWILEHPRPDHHHDHPPKEALFTELWNLRKK